MFPSSFFYILFLVLFYLIISLPVFNQFYETSKQVIDEEFHLRQGKYYCEGNFTVWDPKITTLPGLYLYSAALLSSFKLCTTYYLRLTSLVASAINLYVIFEIRNIHHHENSRKMNSAYSALEALTIALLPPMYMFSHLYYTDIISITMVLTMLLCSLQNRHKLSATFGFLSILMRQTNIVWVGLVFGYNLLDDIMSQSLHLMNDKKKVPHHHLVHYDFLDILTVVKHHLQDLRYLKQTIQLILNEYTWYIAVMFGFVTFIFINGSIVVGDKSAHVAQLHLPQLFYFALFYTYFGVSTVLSNFKSTVKFILKRWHIMLAAVLFMAIIIHQNTLVHPYLLADNRHYTFYLWNRLYGKYEYAKYMAIPVYIFGLTNLWVTIKSKSTGFILFYVVALFGSIALQQLLEIRYFLLPFLIIRVIKFKPKVNFVICEFFVYLFINTFTFYIFFTKDIYWSDYSEPQKLIW